VLANLSRVSTATRERLSAEERREQVLGAAVEEFAGKGLDGTPTEAIAKRAGISQPYLFRLFRTKKELFLACVDLCFARTQGTFERAAKGRSGHEALEAMGHSYEGLLEDRTLLLAQMQAYVACEDPEVRDFVRAGFKRLYEFVSDASGASPDELRQFFATGMLMNVVAAMQLDRLRQPWARDLVVSKDATRVGG